MLENLMLTLPNNVGEFDVNTDLWWCKKKILIYKLTNYVEKLNNIGQPCRTKFNLAHFDV